MASFGEPSEELMTTGKEAKKIFVDVATIEVKGGKGGDGAVHFRREKFVPRGGPDGGDGGQGGSVYLVGDKSLKTLLDFKYRRLFRAEDGRPGGPSKRTGRSGKDVYIKVPLGTVVYDAETGEVIGEILEDGQKLLVARGGKGGRGNARFATPTQRVPRIAEKGEPGERRKLRLELKLIADVGIVGYPNAGKTTLLKALSGASGKIAPYPFTTLTPNLGMVQLPDFTRFAVVDIPGIIDGAHLGKGMGLAFLRHIERTRLLLFVLDITQEPEKAYKNLRKELYLYKSELLERPRIVVLNKIDLVENPDEIPFRPEEGEKVEVYRVSALTGKGVDELMGGIIKWLREITQKENGKGK